MSKELKSEQFYLKIAWKFETNLLIEYRFEKHWLKPCSLLTFLYFSVDTLTSLFEVKSYIWIDLFHMNRSIFNWPESELYFTNLFSLTWTVIELAQLMNWFRLVPILILEHQLQCGVIQKIKYSRRILFWRKF
jgi:hypothetical protein